MKIKLMRWMNSNVKKAVAILCLIGYSLHVVYEIRVMLHAGTPITTDALVYIATQALIVWLGAAVAGWAIDLVFTKSEEEAGEID